MSEIPILKTVVKKTVVEETLDQLYELIKKTDIEDEDFGMDQAIHY